MKEKFDPKIYQGKDRIYRRIKGYEGVLRIFIWNPRIAQYAFSETGKICLARRWEVSDYGKKVRVTQYFDSLEEARSWRLRTICPLTDLSTKNTLDTPLQGNSSPLFRDIVEEWKERKYPLYAVTTCRLYDQYLKNHFQDILEIPIRSIDSKMIDKWLGDRKKLIGKQFQSLQRRSFEHELDLFSVILRYYHEYHEDNSFVFPIKKRHRQDAIVRRFVKPKSKDLKLEEFWKLKGELHKCKYGSIVARLASVQFFQALRVSEVAALHWEDVKLDFKNPSNSFLTIRRYVQFSRRREDEAKIEDGFKNAKVNDGIKELPLRPEAFRVLKELYYIGAKGLVFPCGGTFFTYRQLQNFYNRALKKAGLQYSGTHIMRHGGCSVTYNETNDIDIAAQLLGNKDLRTVRIYAKRDAGALKKFTQSLWQNDNFEGGVVASGRKHD